MLRTLTQPLSQREGETCRPFRPRILLLKCLPRPDGRGYLTLGASRLVGATAPVDDGKAVSSDNLKSRSNTRGLQAQTLQIVRQFPDGLS